MQPKTREAKRSFATDTQMARLATRLMLGETKVDLISDTKDKIHSRKFLEGKGCGKYTSYRVRYLEYGALQRKRLLLSKADKN